MRFNAGLGTGPAPLLHVSGNMLLDRANQQVLLHGVNRSGTESMCVNSGGIFDGPSDQASIAAMRRWHVNAVRVLLNEACWNGASYVKPPLAGLNYQRAIRSYVRLLNRNGIIAILDLHWSGGYYSGPLPHCDSSKAICQKPMPDRAALAFWKSVATVFGHNDAIIFDLFNEPFIGGAYAAGNPATWRCWLHGGRYCGGLKYTAVGMQQLVDAVRSAGATNVLMAGGLSWANDITEWLRYEPRDPLHDLAVSWHSYSYNLCNSTACWNRQVASVAAHVPVIAGEIGENDCRDGYVRRLASWLDARRISYLAFAWDAWPEKCNGAPALISSYTGTATAFGSGYQGHLNGLAARARKQLRGG